MYKQDETAGIKEEAVKQRKKLGPEKIIAIIGAAVLLAKALLCSFFLLYEAYILYVESYDFYPRNMNWGMSVQEVLEREDVGFNLLERDWGILLESKEDVEFCGYDAKLVYAFVDDKLLSGLLYIYNDSIAEKRQTEDSIAKYMWWHNYDIIEDEGGPYHDMSYYDVEETRKGFRGNSKFSYVEKPDPFWKENVTIVFYECNYWDVFWDNFIPSMSCE